MIRFKTASLLRRDLFVSTADATAYSVMIGCGEIFFPAFVLALGLGPVAAGLIPSLSILIAALVQLITPVAVNRLGSNRLWVIGCTTIQSASFLPLIFWAIQGKASFSHLLVVTSIYWSAGMAGVPAWNTWMGVLIPAQIRAAYFAQRNRLAQLATLIGFLMAGLALQVAEQFDIILPVFACLFAVASVSRTISTLCLLACREVSPRLSDNRHQSPKTIQSHVEGNLLRQLWKKTGAIVHSPAGALMAFLWTFAFSAQLCAPYFTPYMLDNQQFSYAAYMMVVGTGLLAKASAMPVFGNLGKKIGSDRLLRLGAISIIPLSSLWLFSSNVVYLMGVQVMAGIFWACYELATSLLFFEAVHHRERTGVVTIHNLGLSLATLAGAATGGTVLRWLGENQSAYFAVFILSGVFRLTTMPLLLRVRTHPKRLNS